jgi:hypothetical protein
VPVLKENGLSLFDVNENPFPAVGETCTIKIKL